MPKTLSRKKRRLNPMLSTKVIAAISVYKNKNIHSDLIVKITQLSGMGFDDILLEKMVRHSGVKSNNLVGIVKHAAHLI